MKWLLRCSVDHMREDIPLDEDDLHAIHKQAVRRLRRDRWFIIGCIPLAVLALVITFAANRMIPLAWLGGWQSTVSFIIRMLILMVAMMTFYALMRSRYDHFQRAIIRGRGFEICLGCGYWLQTLPEDVGQCPECGRKREPLPTDSPAPDQQVSDRLK